ncbi:hypothetical protein DL767_004217 [Monosporascus sp. MG133]|nr:hypothetical protein DL767_004217 [Monosporascus sp. MG133]
MAATLVSTTGSTPCPLRSRKARTQAWITLFVHGGTCVALALSVALGLDGYEAGDDSDPRSVEGRLLLRVSEITTLVSVALVVIKLIVGMWSTTILWASARHMFKKCKSPTEVSSMLRWNHLLWLRHGVPGDSAGWIISLTFLAVFIQSFTSPILTGSGPFNKRWHLRTAAGYASLAWADPTTSSVLLDATLPCINIHGIQWYRSVEEVADEDWLAVNTSLLSLVNDNPFSYYHDGASVVYDWMHMRGSKSDGMPPPSHMFSGTKTVALLINRHYMTEPPCTGLVNTKFGNLDASPYYLQPRVYPDNSTWEWHERGSNFGENCYIVGRINFTAGVTKSSRARYIMPRVVEDQTPTQDVKFEPNPWVFDAIWLLPDLMTMISAMNTSQLPTFDNIDVYVGELTRQAFLGAWDMLTQSFVEDGPTHSAFPAQRRLLADVSNRRVFSWLATFPITKRSAKVGPDSQEASPDTFWTKASTAGTWVAALSVVLALWAFVIERIRRAREGDEGSVGADKKRRDASELDG